MSFLRVLKSIIFSDSKGAWRETHPAQNDQPDERRDDETACGGMTRSQFLSELEKLKEAE